MCSHIVSVILPVFNGEPWVLDAIRSIQQQTFSDWELIILDDGSTDRSLEICQACASQDQRIRVYANGTNLGLARTMNKLVKMAKGKYIAVQEQDDISMPERFAREVALLDSHPEVGLVSGVAAWLDDAGNIFNYFPGRLYRREPYPEKRSDMVAYLYTEQCKVVNAACMFRRQILDDVAGPFDEEARLSIDWQFFIHVAHKYRIAGIPDVLVKMRRGQEHSHLTTRKKVQFDEARRCIKLVYDKYKSDVGSPINYQLYRKAIATELILEGRFWGRGKGLGKLIKAVIFDPLNMQAWTSIEELGRGVLQKLKVLKG